MSLFNGFHIVSGDVAMLKSFFRCNLALLVSVLFVGCNPSANNSSGLLPFLSPSQGGVVNKNSNSGGFQLQNTGGRYSIQSLTAPPLVVGDGAHCTYDSIGNIQSVAQNAIDITPDIPIEIQIGETTLKYCFFKVSQATYKEFHMFASAVSTFGEVEIRVGRENEIPTTVSDWEFDANAGLYVDESLNSIPFHDNSYRYIWLRLGQVFSCSPLDPCKYNFSVVTANRPANCSVLFDTAVNNAQEVLMGESVSVQTASVNTVCMFKYRTNLPGRWYLSVNGNSNKLLSRGYLNSRPIAPPFYSGTPDWTRTNLKYDDSFRYIWVWTGDTGCDFDNCSFTIDSSHIADPAIQSGTLSQIIAAQGDPISVTYEMKNLSNLITFWNINGATVEHYLDTNPECSRSANYRSDGQLDYYRMLTGTDIFGAKLLPLESVLQTFNTVIPDMGYSTSRVMYYCIAFDPYQQLPDHNIDNNRKFVAPVTILLTSTRTRTDLIGLGFSVNPSSIEPGVPFTLNYGLKNTAGTNKGSFSTDFDIDFRLSGDPYCSADDTLLARERIVGGMLKGAEIFRTLSLTMPSDFPISVEDRTYYVCAMFDSQNVIAEIDEDNNTIVVPIKVNPSPSHSMYYIAKNQNMSDYGAGCLNTSSSTDMKLYDASGQNHYNHDVAQFGIFELNNPNIMFYYLKQGSSYNLRITAEPGYIPYSIMWTSSTLIGINSITVSNCTPSGDIYEPNDTPTSAGLLPLDTRQEHHLDSSYGDTQDWIKLVVP